MYKQEYPPSSDFTANGLWFKYNKCGGVRKYTCDIGGELDLSICIVCEFDEDELDYNSEMYSTGVTVAKTIIHTNNGTIYGPRLNMSTSRFDESIKFIDHVMSGGYSKELANQRLKLDKEIDLLYSINTSKFQELYTSNLIVKDILE